MAEAKYLEIKVEELQALNRQLEGSQKAYLNIMSDMERKSRELEENQKSLLNIMDDLEKSHKELQASAQREKELRAAAAAAEKAKVETLEGAKAELEKKVEERTAQIKEMTAGLVQTTKLTALGELSAGVAHELNQPLNAIKIICQSTLRDVEKNRYNQDSFESDLKEIVGNVNRMAEIIDHMRVFSRKTEGTPHEKINITEPLEGVFKILGQQFKVHNIEVLKE
ncbi:MAG: hypothetical protein HY747_10390, partial [Elusimicrobia bacterium]|nr:hypothetical protein [Elusimicrobiota bacterium]